MLPLIRVWTDQERSRLLELIASGASPMKCAAALKRRVASVRKQAREMGHPFPSIHQFRRGLKEAAASAERR